MTYEKPELTLVGDAQDTILGIAIDGCDMDMNYIFSPNQWETETIE